MKKIISLISLLLVLAMLAAGCAKTPEENTGDTTVDTADNGLLYDDNGYLKDGIPEEIDYDGALIKIKGWKDTEASRDFNEDGSKGDYIASKTYSRNRKVEDRLNVELEFDLTHNGNNAARYEYIQVVENALRTDIKYDLIACYSMNAANFASDGFLTDLMDQNALDTEKPWWPQLMVENSTINNKLYFASGSISTTSTMQSMVLALNLNLMHSMGYNDPRDLVIDDQWTMNTFFEMCTDTYVDLNHETDGKDSGDRFGLVMFDSVMGDAFLTSNGLKYLSTDDSGKIVIAPEFKGEKIHALAETLIQKFKSDDFWYNGKDTGNSPIFIEERALFMGTTFFALVNVKKDISFEYGYLPFPKADAAQENYYTCVGYPFTMWCIPLQCENHERAAYVMECLASEGYRQVQPEVYQEVKYRSGSDALNAEMFDIIIGSTVYDIGRIFHNEFEWKDSPVGIFRSRLYKYDSSDWYSVLAGKQNAMESVIAGINSSFGF